MKHVWSEEGKLASWLEVELAALDAWAELGVVPAKAAIAVRERAVPPSPERVAEIEERTQHDLAAFVDALAETLGESVSAARDRAYRAVEHINLADLQYRHDIALAAVHANA